MTTSEIVATGIDLVAKVEAATRLALALSDTMLLGHLAERFTCSEADDFAAFIEAWISPELASEFLDNHAESDDEDDNHYDRKESA